VAAHGHPAAWIIAGPRDVAPRIFAEIE
jgi:hypothetical protein